MFRTVKDRLSSALTCASATLRFVKSCIFLFVVVAFLFGYFWGIVNLYMSFDSLAFSSQPCPIVFRWRITFQVERLSPFRRQTPFEESQQLQYSGNFDSSVAVGKCGIALLIRLIAAEVILVMRSLGLYIE
jgi:hypothetical protein